MGIQIDVSADGLTVLIRLPNQPIARIIMVYPGKSSGPFDHTPITTWPEPVSIRAVVKLCDHRGRTTGTGEGTTILRIWLKGLLLG